MRNLKKFSVCLAVVILLCFVAMMLIGEQLPTDRGGAPIDVGYSYWGGESNFPYNISRQSNLLKDLLKAGVYLIGVYSLGVLVLLQLIDRNTLSNNSFKFGFSLLCGYLIITILSRLLTLVMSIKVMALLILFLLFFSIIYSYRKNSAEKWLNSNWVIFITLAVCGVQTDGVHVLGDGHSFFLNILETKKLDIADNAILFSQQYDDFIFILPLVHGPLRLSNILVGWWLAFTIMKYVSAQFIYTAARNLSCGRLSAFLIVAFVMFNYSNLIPSSHNLSFDSGPWLFGVTSGSRVLVIATMILCISLHKEKIFQMFIIRNYFQLFIGLLLGMALATLSPTMIPALVFLVFAYWLNTMEKETKANASWVFFLFSVALLWIEIAWIHYNLSYKVILLSTGLVFAISVVIFSIIYLYHGYRLNRNKVERLAPDQA